MVLMNDRSPYKIDDPDVRMEGEFREDTFGFE